MLTNDTRWYSSALDWWLAVILVALPVVATGVLIAAVFQGEGVWASILGVLIVAGIYGGLIMPVRYGLAPDDLVVRFGLVRRRVPYTDIRRVHPTHNPLSSPALSLNRLCIDTGAGLAHRVMISPAHRSDFLDGLARRTGLERRGDALEPVPGSQPRGARPE